MDGFEVTVGALRSVGGAAGSVAGDVAALPLAEAASAVGEALPGGAAVDATAVLAEGWRSRVAATADALTRHAVAMPAAADGYEASERAAVARLAGER
jgi:hypothetical protein